MTRAIRNIKFTQWFARLQCYPETTEKMLLFVSIIDKLNLIDDNIVDEMAIMDAIKLDIIYIVLRITNVIFNDYLQYVLEHIFCQNFIKIFKSYYSDIFVDQLWQDLDYFICNYINFEELDANIIQSELREYLRNTLTKSGITIDTAFFIQHDELFKQTIDTFIVYTREIFNSIRETMQLIINTAYITKEYDELFEIKILFERNFDIEELLNSECMEINIYHEHSISSNN